MPVSPRDIPSIDGLCQLPDVADLVDRHGRQAAVDALRAAASLLRDRLATDPAGMAVAGVDTAEHVAAWVVAEAAALLASSHQPSLVPVINATGVVVHTNLGRAPLAEPALRHVVQVAGGYTNLEYDLTAGGRGRRDVHAESLLCRLTGAEAAVVVNNNAAATLLALAALTAGREVVISRGELVEIGGGFRVPDILRQSGAVLREVGTTNRTRASDYAAAIGDRTAAILRVHPSNFRVEGFTERPALDEITALGRRFSIPVVEDLGNGHVLGPSLGLEGQARAGASRAVHEEPSVQDSLRAGIDVLCVSGDKLLGGPQAGIVLGRRGLIEQVRRHPLMRALRVDKLTYAALEGTLLEHLAGRAARTIPVVAMLSMTAATVDARARRLADRLRSGGLQAEVMDGVSTIGGGSAPGATLATRLVAITTASTPNALEASLRRQSPPVVARIDGGAVVLDLRTVPDADDERLASLVLQAADAARR